MTTYKAVVNNSTNFGGGGVYTAFIFKLQCNKLEINYKWLETYIHIKPFISKIKNTFQNTTWVKEKIKTKNITFQN